MGETPVADSAIVLDGFSLTLDELVRVARDAAIRVDCDPAAIDAVSRLRQRIDAIADDYRKAIAANDPDPRLTYGITTGFGEFKTKPIDPGDLERLQRDILRSHSAGVGINADLSDTANYVPAEVVRAVLALRLNTFLRGQSGVTPLLVECVAGMLNEGVIPLVPTRGSVGSSGDLAPLAHLFSVLARGDGGGREAEPGGRFYLLAERDAQNPGAMPELHAGGDLEDFVPGAADYRVGVKEGLALSNGATFSAAMLALAVHDAEEIASCADVAAALSLEAQCGCARAFDPRVHAARSMAGQIQSAANIRRLVEGSSLIDRAAAAGLVQDVYSLRCAPQVHGASRDAVGYARDVVQRELNATTDNPLILEPDGTDAWDASFAGNWTDSGADYAIQHDNPAYSAGNFHGQPLALAADFLAIALAELANISERRIQLQLDEHMNRNLPPNLVARAGVNSGYMLAQYSAASLVSENKVLCHPASVDSIPTSSNSEDHNAMAETAARKLRTVVANVQAVLAIEFLVAAQAVEWRAAMGPDGGIRPVKDDRLPEEDGAPSKAWERERDLRRRYADRCAPEARAAVADRLGVGTRAAYRAVREVAEPVIDDRTLDEPIAAARALVEDGAIGRAVSSVLADQM